MSTKITKEFIFSDDEAVALSDFYKYPAQVLDPSKLDEKGNPLPVLDGEGNETGEYVDTMMDNPQDRVDFLQDKFNEHVAPWLAAASIASAMDQIAQTEEQTKQAIVENVKARIGSSKEEVTD